MSKDKETDFRALESDIAADPGLRPVADSDAEWRDRLSPQAFQVLRRAGTERPFTGEYVDLDEEGIYRCAACGNQLFSSETKYHSGCGWPSFTSALPDAVIFLDDTSHGMFRTEVRCARCQSHLGHIFNDGPREAGGMRYCMNSVALAFEPPKR